ncbi:ribosome recycling factor [Oceanihabitans sp. IOP_32]|uniref:ribosome recycling factor n=1 Tax=Oceanihabitans sp. IOP_32 TaxID=2529032 RepID=UPI0012937D37|nr:ribosome recycling factor [Oceanihabitans sp. IOP_32]QFZ54366.1 ribosome recycling factor [Oceanihabitans sp. IOP_32]
MSEDVKFILDTAKEAMDNAIKHLEKQLVNIRAGKASPAMLGSVMVDYYGSQTPLSQVANVNTPDGRTITVQPWEKSMLQEIERGIAYANLGFNPMNNGETIIINVPPLTEERRLDLAKQAKAESEEAKISVRTGRKEAMNEVKRNEDISEDLKKNTEIEIQKITDSYVKKIDDIFETKEKEIMTI